MRSAVCRVCKEEFWDGALHKLDRPQDKGKPEMGAEEEEGSWLTHALGAPARTCAQALYTRGSR